MTTPRIDLLSLGAAEPPEWDLGAAEGCPDEPDRVAAALNCLAHEGRSEAILTWDRRLGSPDPKTILRALGCPGDIWHAGLALGMGGLPRLLDYPRPTWMLSVDPPIETEATSWRISLRSSLIRSEVLRQLGGPDAGFRSIAGASLDLGHRYVSRGALTRHLPWLLGPDQTVDRRVLPIEDEVRFLGRRVGKFWSRWAIVRAFLDGRVSIRDLGRLWKLNELSLSSEQPSLQLTRSASPESVQSGTVTVLIPTLDRYEYLETLLGQLAQQTVMPSQILVVDQTPPGRRRSDLKTRHPNLPLEVIYRGVQGQCSSRNAGLQAATGEWIAFLDDDVEIPEDLIERHLKTLGAFGAEVSSGVAEEVGSGPLPPDFEVARVSDVFPTNNTMVRRFVLERSGLFDLAYEHGPRADGDLGMRVFLSGALMVLNPEIRVLHHHAPVGGLRSHRARAVTYAGSRRHVLQRNVPEVTEIYYAKRYFRRDQTRESLLLRVLGTFAARGSAPRRVLKGAFALLTLPLTLAQCAIRSKKAGRLLRRYPEIPSLDVVEEDVGS